MADILAPMSGNIWKILAGEGDPVAEDQEILIMEAMKMEIPVTAPQKGRLASLKVKEGDPVEAETLLAVVE
ncbi:MAG: acetyl-CoA carboxylase biotin carboxyl carrier protein subunit [Deltaproteobacteria bacterium]|jgi:acetyl-CoA carboxylase biotin carboxyl carrier protein|nr:acetyl-CoA carboxylase biotin carboxyl carrier protein subunit [Deltaproteobacteria bacterium]MDR1310166.1 acetyl-CoA carboxylase biotin carboxyl carrier protein subunit [Deltaproteobacteria bacterium]